RAGNPDRSAYPVARTKGSHRAAAPEPALRLLVLRSVHRHLRRHPQLGGLTSDQRQRGEGRTALRPSSVRVGLVITLLATVAGGFCWWGWHLLGEGARLEPGMVLPLAVLGLGGVLLRERNLGPHLGVSVSSVVLAAAVALVGPVGA